MTSEVTYIPSEGLEHEARGAHREHGTSEGEVALDKTLFSDAAKPADEAGTDKNVKRALFSMQTEMAEKAKQKNDAEAIVKALEAEAKKK